MPEKKPERSPFSTPKTLVWVDLVVVALFLHLLKFIILNFLNWNMYFDTLDD